MSPAPAARLRAVMEGVPSALAVVDAGGRVLERNARWHAMGGPAPGADWRALVHADHRGRLPGPAGGTVEVLAGDGRDGARWVTVTVSGGDEAVVTVGEAADARTAEAEGAALHRIADAVTRGDDPAEVFRRVAEEVAWLVRADGAGVAEFTGEDLAPLVGTWSADPELRRVSPPALPVRGDGTTARVYATGRPCRVDYAETTGPDGPFPHPWRSSAAAPIHVDGRLWGALGVVSLESGRLAPDAEDRLARAAELVGLAIANARARDALERQARTDPLTGLPHHGAFHDALADEVTRAARYGHPLSVAVLDLDHFKAVNDEHGHAAGDRALREVAARMSDLARTVDVTGRLGGEEFAWLMPETDLPGALAAGERLRVAISARPVGPAGRLTVSIGVAALEAGEGGAGLMRRADRALYAAKGEGRDRTVVAGPPGAA